MNCVCVCVCVVTVLWGCVCVYVCNECKVCLGVVGGVWGGEGEGQKGL